MVKKEVHMPAGLQMPTSPNGSCPTPRRYSSPGMLQVPHIPVTAARHIPFYWLCTTDVYHFMLSCVLVASLILGSMLLFHRQSATDTPAWVRARRMDTISICPASDTIAGITASQIQPDPMPNQTLYNTVAARHFPVGRGVCGSWVHGYMDLQRQAIAKLEDMQNPPPRFAISVTDDDGLSDRLFTATTVFMYALLSDRAYFNLFRAGYDLWTGLPSSYIDWRLVPPLDKVNLTRSAPGRAVIDYYDPHLNGKVRKELREILWLHNFTNLASASTTAVLRINTGAATIAFDNPAVHCKLVRLGLTRHSIFPCLFDYLFRPAPSTFALYPQETALLQDPEVIKIGIQIREGDKVFQKNYHPTNLNFFKPYFHCAEQLEAQYYRQGAKRVIWYVMSDSLALRQLVEQEYGDKILTNTDHALDHTLMQFNARPPTQDDYQRTLGIAAGEMWLFSLADSHIITEKSGYGRLGAVLSMKNSTYTIRKQLCLTRHSCLMLERRECSLNKPDPDITDTVWI